MRTLSLLIALFISSVAYAEDSDSALSNLGAASQAQGSTAAR